MFMLLEKPNKHVIIPCNPAIIEMFEKYKQNSNMLPRTISNPKFNEYIKRDDIREIVVRKKLLSVA